MLYNMEDFLLNIINEIRSLKGLKEIASLNRDMDLRDDLALSSFDLAELTVRIEDEYDVDVFGDGLVNTVGEIFDKLSK